MLSIHRFFIISSIFIIHLFANTETEIKRQIGNMLIMGFEEAVINNKSQVIQDIQNHNLGGVILFDRFYDERDKIKNIQSLEQLKRLTHELKKVSPNLIISIDQEGGKVERLKKAHGFTHTQSASAIALLPLQDARKEYMQLSKGLKELGINMNFAPVVDLAINPKNKVIYQLQRSYSNSSENVVKYASSFMDALREQNIISVLKHFPGHGSSLDDSHKGLVDVTHTWSELELEPYKQLIQFKDIPMIMTAHVFNDHLDKEYPATLSYLVNTKLLRDEMGFKGVVISDDLQMNAIRKHYDLKKTVTLAINSGVDILLFGNQLANNSVEEVVDTIYEQVNNGAISYERIVQANQRINALKKLYLHEH